jgi:hypothetical protein
MSIRETSLSFDLLEPWKPLTDDGSALVAELRRELRTDHALHGIEAHAIAMRCDCDDVLFRIIGRPEQYAVVHLTWSGKTDPNKGWPSTELFNDEEDWRVRRMIPDHEDFTT